MDVQSLVNALRRQDFGDKDSIIASSIMHPAKAINKLAEALRGEVNTAYGIPDKFDNPTPWLAPSREQQASSALNLAGLLQTGAFASGAAPKSAGGTLGTFIGKNALTWDAKAAKKAAGLLKRGIDPEKVWQRHMTGQMPDGALFQEIDDSAARIGNVFMKDNPISWTAKDLMRENPERPNINIANLMSHDGIYRAYPELENTGVNFSGDLGGSMRLPKLGQTNYQMDLGELEKGASVPLHELQHAIQGIEGWSRGGSPNEFVEQTRRAWETVSDQNKILLNLVKEMDKAKSAGDKKALSDLKTRFAKEMDFKERKTIDARKDPFEQYQKLTGEAQARATQDRLNMGMDERRTNYPLRGGMLADIPLDQLIYKYGTIEGKP